MHDDVSGAAAVPRDGDRLERLRWRVFQPGADDADRVAYAAALEAGSGQLMVADGAPHREPPAAADFPRGERAGAGRRRVRFAALAVGSCAGAALLLPPLVAAPLGRSGPQDVAATPLAVAPAQRGAARRAARAATAHLETFGSEQATIELAQLTDRVSQGRRRAAATAGAIGAAGASSAGTPVRIDGSSGLIHDVRTGGLLWVQLATPAGTRWSWQVWGVSPDRSDPHLVFTVRGEEAGGLPGEALLRLPKDTTPVRLAIRTAGSEPFRWRVVAG